MLGDLLGSILNFGKTDKGLFTLLAALTSAADRDRGTRPTGGGVTYGMSAPRRLQQVGGLGRYQDVVRFDEGGPTISVNEPSPLLWGLTQGPYGPLLAYDIGPKMERPSMAPGAPRKTEATQGYLSGQEGPGMENTPSGNGVPGQGVSSLTQGLGLGLMAYGTNPLMPYSLPASLIGKALVDQQINAMGKAQSEMENMLSIPGINVISDENGNIIGISNPESIAAADIANFGTSQSVGEQNVSTNMASIAEGTGGDVGGDVGGIGGIGDVGPGSGGESPWAEGGYVTQYADGGSVFSMQDGGFVMTKDAVEGAGGPQGIAQILPQARMIGGPPDPTGKRDLTPAKITGPNGVTPARVSRGEAYVPPEGVRQAGGARQLYNLMNKLQRRA